MAKLGVLLLLAQVLLFLNHNDFIESLISGRQRTTSLVPLPSPSPTLSSPTHLAPLLQNNHCDFLGPLLFHGNLSMSVSHSTNKTCIVLLTGITLIYGLLWRRLDIFMRLSSHLWTWSVSLFIQVSFHVLQ